MKKQTVRNCEAAFSACWADARTLVVDSRFTSAATGTRLIFTFDESGLEIRTRSSIPAPAGLMDSAYAGTIRLSGAEC